MSKRKVGKLYRKRIVEGNINEVNPNSEIHVDHLKDGGSSSNMEYLYVEGIDEELKEALRTMAVLERVAEDYDSYYYATIGVANSWAGGGSVSMRVDAVAIDFSLEVNGYGDSGNVDPDVFCTIKDVLIYSGLWDTFNAIPRITKEEFYTTRK